MAADTGEGSARVRTAVLVLGMHRREIRAKFDEIVAFAEVERFLDTPVKRYSSGMYVRLAFAVAAHLEPEILIVDEVLAVGDAEFQKKCLGKMESVAKGEGRTVLFVSHQMGAVNRLCQNAIWMEEGSVRLLGPVTEIVSGYLEHPSGAIGERSWPDTSSAPGDERIKLRAVRVLGPSDRAATNLDIQHACVIELEYHLFISMTVLRRSYRVTTAEGEGAFTTADGANSDRMVPAPRGPGIYVSRCLIPGNLLNENTYSVTVSADVPFVEILFFEENVLRFHVEQTGGVSGRYGERWPGVVCPNLEWEIKAKLIEATSAPSLPLAPNTEQVSLGR